jgi:hypothetical protein
MRARLIGSGAMLMGFLLIVLVATASALAADPPEFRGSFGPEGTGSGSFSKPGSVAVDQQEHWVYVLDVGAGSLLRFDREGQPVDFGGSAGYITGNAISGLSFFAGNGESQVAVDSTSHDFYVTTQQALLAFHADGEPAIFSAGPGAGTNELPYPHPGTELLGVAVDSNGTIYASDYAGATVDIYAHSGEPITEFSVAEPANLAVDTSGAVYVNRWHGSVLKFNPSAYPVTSLTTYTAAPEPLATLEAYSVAVDPATNDVYVAQGIVDHTIAWYDEAGTLEATFGDEEGVYLGVGIDGESTMVENTTIFGAHAATSGPSRVEIFKPKVFYEGKPRVEHIAASDVSGNSATLTAGINPGSYGTTYVFQYGLQDCSLGPCTSVPAVAVSIGSGHEEVKVSQALTGLAANTVYHYRVVANNSKGSNLDLDLESDHTFTTQTNSLGFQLSDSRAWELVSPPNKHGALLQGSQNAHVQAAGNGESVIYASRGSIEPAPAGNRTAESSTVLGRRTGSGWDSKDITLPNNNVTEIPIGSLSEYKLFGRDLSAGLVEPRTTAPLSSQSTERTPYLRQNTEPPVFTPLVTADNVLTGTKFGGDPRNPLGPVSVAGATPDMKHVVLNAQVPLVEGAPPSPSSGLYLWSAGVLQPVSVLPSAEGGGLVSTDTLGSGSHHISAGHTVHNAISSDGSRVFWSAQDLGALYLRDTVAGETVRIDVEAGGSGVGAHEPIFQGASTDGTSVFFTDTQHLTSDASPSGRDLYRCEIPAGSIASGCSSLVDISAAGLSGESAEVEGLAPGVGDDGSTVYFVARGVLDPAANQDGETATPEKPNLYAWNKGEGVRYIATLSEEDDHDWGTSLGIASRMSASASPSGRYLAFASERPLAGNDNLDIETGEPVQRVYRYDAIADQLACISCKPSGAAPEGELAGVIKLVDPRGEWSGDRIAAVLPEPTMFDVVSEISLYSPRTVLDNGRVFFNAADSLVPADVNGQWDVYQYEPAGLGSCSQSSGDAATARSAGGCVSLLSSGTGESEAGFLDASESGDDVFFMTPARLNAVDVDSELDVYDSRVNGTPASVPPRVECVGEACQAAGAQPNDPPLTSSVFSGPGNVKPAKVHCRKGQRKVRRHGKTRCVKHKHRHKRSGHGRRASR